MVILHCGDLFEAEISRNGSKIGRRKKSSFGKYLMMMMMIVNIGFN